MDHLVSSDRMCDARYRDHHLQRTMSYISIIATATTNERTASDVPQNGLCYELEHHITAHITLQHTSHGVIVAYCFLRDGRNFTQCKPQQPRDPECI
jgi:hypothetical protein